MDRAEAEGRVIEYVDAQDDVAVELLRSLVRTRSLAGQEGTVAQPGTLVAQLRPALGQLAAIDVAEQDLTPTSQNLIEVLHGPSRRCFVIDAHTDTVPEGQPGRWFDGHPFSAAEGEVHYLGDRRIRLEVGNHQHEAVIRDHRNRIVRADLDEVSARRTRIVADAIGQGYVEIRVERPVLDIVDPEGSCSAGRRPCAPKRWRSGSTLRTGD